MANDRMQEEIDDFVNGNINEQVEGEVNRRFTEMMRGKGYTHEQEVETKKQLRQEVRQEILDNMEFKRRYQEERHLDDLQDQQRRYDSERYQYTSAQMQDRWWNQKQAMHSEERIYTDDINGINPNAVVDRYADIANFFNITDTIAMQRILENAQNGNIDGVAFRGLIESAEGKKMVEMLMSNNNGTLNMDQLVDSVSQMMQSNEDSRIKTAKGYVEVAQKDLEARAAGVERKVDALNKVATTAPERDQSYLDTIDNAYSQGMESARRSEDTVKRKISLAEIEKATDSVPLSKINAKTQAVKQIVQAQEQEKTDVEKE